MRYKPLGHCCDILTSLPLDIARYILSQLPLKGVLNASLVSHAWNQIVSDAILWRLLFERKEKWHICTDLLPRLPHIPYKDPTLPFVDWKSVYMNRLELDRRWYTLKTKPRGDSIAIPFQPSKVQLEDIPKAYTSPVFFHQQLLHRVSTCSPVLVTIMYVFGTVKQAAVWLLSTGIRVVC